MTDETSTLLLDRRFESFDLARELSDLGFLLDGRIVVF